MPLIFFFFFNVGLQTLKFLQNLSDDSSHFNICVSVKISKRYLARSSVLLQSNLLIKSKNSEALSASVKFK